MTTNRTVTLSPFLEDDLITVGGQIGEISHPYKNIK